VKTVSLKIPSIRNNIKQVEELLFMVNQDFHLDEQRFVNLLIGVSECVMNSIVHGNNENKSKFVDVIIDYDDEKLIVKICDEGVGVNLDLAKNPHLPEDILDNAGRGMFIVKSLFKDVNYRNTEKGSECVITVEK
jgi:serine/threonine-protein kinase RsbW